MTAQAQSSRTVPPARVTEIPLAPQPPALILFGRDSGGRPRAAWFNAVDAEAATAAAATMRLRALPLADDAGRDIAQQLARGRVLPSGRALVPFTKRTLYAGLVALAGEEAGLTVAADQRADPVQAGAPPLATPPSAAQASPIANANRAASTGDGASSSGAKPRPVDRTFIGQPKPREPVEIGLGSVVLAHESPDEGWWEAEVIGINGRVFSLRWRDYPTQPTILRKATELALLPPGEA
ncbi:hypothetical protein [Methylorubrum populi]|uniref:Uncharacterized protein n=1 Tax=Methylorubrum populi TaxID=223967 RepID=A0A833J8N9_9HYPH|nr:hypothetical protein [Methylorubrum populi]KAB7786364.1 hypothetical protein F8B43_1765 [Methylorubrum populi]